MVATLKGQGGGGGGGDFERMGGGGGGLSFGTTGYIPGSYAWPPCGGLLSLYACMQCLLSCPDKV